MFDTERKALRRARLQARLLSFLQQRFTIKFIQTRIA